jgi:hypothetical protein
VAKTGLATESNCEVVEAWLVTKSNCKVARTMLAR